MLTCLPATPPVSHWRRQDGGGGSGGVKATRFFTAYCWLPTAALRPFLVPFVAIFRYLNQRAVLHLA